MNRISLLISALAALIICSFGSPEDKGFAFSADENGLALSENGKPYLFYQTKPKSPDNKTYFNNYLHPVYSINGEVVTEEFPADHLHHRGIFWAWHQLYAGSISLGDQWMMTDITQEVMKVEKSTTAGYAVIRSVINWRSSRLPQNKAFIEEQTKIIARKSDGQSRIIDFEIILRPLVKNLEIGGSDDEKGYGGFSVRTKLSKNTLFFTETGRITPQNLQLKAGSWIDLSPIPSGANLLEGIAIICHKENPGFPEPWILRQEKSMQNAAFPGRNRLMLNDPVRLRYRIVIHNGDAGRIDIPALQKELNQCDFNLY